eukprot:SAG22_NODE_9658_length_576_cov_1.081761_2_plen_46_part_00
MPPSLDSKTCQPDEFVKSRCVLSVGSIAAIAHASAVSVKVAAVGW